MLCPACFYCSTGLAVVVTGEASCASDLHQQHLFSVVQPTLVEDFLSSYSEDAEQGLFGYKWTACFFGTEEPGKCQKQISCTLLRSSLPPSPSLLCVLCLLLLPRFVMREFKPAGHAAGTKFCRGNRSFSQKTGMAHEENCRCNMSLLHVPATCLLVCTAFKTGKVIVWNHLSASLFQFVTRNLWVLTHFTGSQKLGPVRSELACSCDENIIVFKMTSYQ